MIFAGKSENAASIFTLSSKYYFQTFSICPKMLIEKSMECHNHKSQPIPWHQEECKTGHPISDVVTKMNTKMKEKNARVQLRTVAILTPSICGKNSKMWKFTVPSNEKHNGYLLFSK